MATKKPAAKSKAEEVAPPATETPTAPSGRVADQPAGGITISPEDAKVLEGDIDSRMKALLKDHKEMGAR